MMKAAAVKSNKQNESRAAANSILQKKSAPKGALRFADNRPGPAAGRLTSVPKGTAASSKFLRLYAPSQMGNVTQRKRFAIQMHKGQDQFDETTDAMIIYKVVLKKDDSVVYIGQTEESVGIDERFTQHLRTHLNWSHSTHKIKRIEAGDWTRFETDCAEQYWIDHFGGKDALENDKNQVSKARFETIIEYQEKHGKTLFRGTGIGFPSGWKPLN